MCLAGEVNAPKQIQETIVFNNENNASILSSIDNLIHVLIKEVSDASTPDFEEEDYEKQYGKKTEGVFTILRSKKGGHLKVFFYPTFSTQTIN